MVTGGRCMLLGGSTCKDRGVLQDYVEAHKWLSLAASRGVPGFGLANL